MTAAGRPVHWHQVHYWHPRFRTREGLPLRGLAHQAATEHWWINHAGDVIDLA